MATIREKEHFKKEIKALFCVRARPQSGEGQLLSEWTKQVHFFLIYVHVYARACVRACVSMYARVYLCMYTWHIVYML